MQEDIDEKILEFFDESVESLMDVYLTKVQPLLDGLLRRNKYIRVAVLSDVTGMPIIYASRGDLSDDDVAMIASASAVLVATSNKTVNNYQMGDLNEVTLEGSNGLASIMPISDLYFLTVFYAKSSPLTALKRDLTYLKKKLKDVLEEIENI
ncbi:MAG: roadblock/LC7 domain-containing protein [Candidatus Njordarchaeia archaeon]